MLFVDTCSSYFSVDSSYASEITLQYYCAVTPHAEHHRKKSSACQISMSSLHSTQRHEDLNMHMVQRVSCHFKKNLPQYTYLREFRAPLIAITVKIY